ncbi:hypothetical protein L1887_10222 [Cichorium endivia]|nr:hypothetical protein L1887_10222 [Cichorium endivia]
MESPYGALLSAVDAVGPGRGHIRWCHLFPIREYMVASSQSSPPTEHFYNTTTQSHKIWSFLQSGPHDPEASELNSWCCTERAQKRNLGTHQVCSKFGSLLVGPRLFLAVLVVW